MPAALQLGAVAEDLPWPNVRRKRSLHIGVDDELRAELERRGAAEIVTCEPSKVHRLDPVSTGPFDVVVACDLIRHTDGIDGALSAIRHLTTGPVLSVEPLDLWLSLVGRGRSRLALDAAGRTVANGTAHRELFLSAGFDIERISRPLSVPVADRPPSSAVGGRLRQVALRLLTGRPGPGVLCRALVVRPRG